MQADGPLPGIAATALANGVDESRPQQAADRPAWQRALQGAIRDVDELLAALQLSREDVPQLDAESPFPLLVPREFVAKMQVGNPQDPLLLQVLPVAQEREQQVGFVDDPVGDRDVQTASGMLQKYPGRVLLIATGMCAVHCRYCFRRHYPYDASPKSQAAWSEAFEGIARDASIEEVIFSGGDPLSLGNGRLSQWMDQLESIPHVQRLRWHTRFPVVLPSRIDETLCERIGQSRLSMWMVLHINHPHEIDSELRAAIARLKRSGVSMLNQAVLLRGINDSLELQRALCRDLVNAGVQPYYLHQLDPVAGAAHFQCDPQLGETLVRALREELSGYAVPRFVQEIPGRQSKTLLA
jgi:EF-P beta-lysylation protein EpmB